MAEPIQQEPDVSEDTSLNAPGWSEYEPDYEIVMESDQEPEVQDEYSSLSKEDLVAKLKQEQEQLNVLKQQADSVAAITSGLNNLNDNLTKRPQVSQIQQPQKPQMSEEEFREYYNKKAFDDPLGAQMELFSKKIEPVLNKVIGTNLYHARNNLSLHPDKKETFAKYQDEIDRQVNEWQVQNPSAVATDPKIYEKAYEQVVSHHIDDIVKLRVDQALAAQQSNTTNGGNAGSGVRNYVEYNGRPAPKKKKRVVTAADYAEADRKGMPIQALLIARDYEEKKKKGMI
jgi:hypothetical protein